MRTLASIVLMTLAISSCMCQAKIPVIDVFIESLCPDSMQFIEGSFKNFYENESHEQLAVVNFYPYGNAKEEFDGKKYEFTCQHGPNECYGNTIETCLLNKIPRKDFHKDLICIEGNVPKVGKDFQKILNICLSDREDLKNKVLECASSEEGNKLEHEIAQKTPEHNYVPWVHFNGEHNKEIENKILDNMLNYLCSISEQKVKGCETQGDFQKLHSLTGSFGSKLINFKQCLANSRYLEFLK